MVQHAEPVTQVGQQTAYTSHLHDRRVLKLSATSKEHLEKQVYAPSKAPQRGSMGHVTPSLDPGQVT